MTLEQYYYIAELIAAVALIISLIYVGIQVRLSTKATQAATAQSYVDTMNGYVGLINSSGDLASILHRGAPGLDRLADEEVVKFCAFHDQCFITFEAFYFEWKSGLLQPELWDTYRHVIHDLLIQPGQREYWEMRRHWYQDEFQRYCEQVIDEEEGKPMHFKAMGASI